MITEAKGFAGLTGNQLKLMAMVAMTADHLGLQLLPQVALLRWIGRLAFPLFAFFIAEGWRYTRSRGRYFLSVALLAALCQGVYLVAMGSLYQCVLVTFSLSMGLMYLLDLARSRKDPAFWCLFALGLITAWFVSRCLPGLLPGTDFWIDYDIWGILLPLLFYLGATKPRSLALGALALLGLSLERGGHQWLCLLSLGLLLCYNGARGRANIKRLFYLYYPAHLAAIYLIGLIFE